MNRWYVMRCSGRLEYLGEFEDIDSADDAAGLDAIWLFDRESLDQWLEVLNSGARKESDESARGV